MKAIRYTRHSKNRMRQHGITEGDIELCLQNPDQLEPSRGKMNAWKRMDDRYLRVTFKDEKQETVIITAVLKKKSAGGKK